MIFTLLVPGGQNMKLKEKILGFGQFRIYWRYALINPSPCGGLVCGPSAHTCAARNQMAAMHTRKHVEKISSGPSAHKTGEF